MTFARPSSATKYKARTRPALGHIVGDVLSVPLAALEARLILLARGPARFDVRNRWLASLTGAGDAHADRLREVLDRDRALIAAQPANVCDVVVPVGAPLPVTAPPNEDGSRGPHQEPIRTKTMARLLASQGYRARALAIYDALLAEGDGDPELRGEAERLRAQPG